MAADADRNDQTVFQRHDPLLGAILDHRFRIDFQLAAGGFGAIYRATDVLADAEVALKVLHPKLARDPSVVARFRREGATLATLRDPHTITAYELGEAADGTLYIVLELLRGESLYERFRAGGPLPWRQVVHIARGVCSSLAEAHAAGVVHRDLKPANIHLETRSGDTDFAKVLDFGIAKIVQGGDESGRNDLTQAGQMIGTLEYMSPEQMVGGELTGRSDIYALGIVMYEMIAGRTPFADAQTATAILAAVLTQVPEPLSRHANVPPLLEQIVMRCLEREAEHRYGEICDVADALAQVAAEAAAEAATRPSGRRSPLPRDATVPSTGFEHVMTNDATRVDVRIAQRSDTSQPVIDARGPRHWAAPVAATPSVALPSAGVPPPAPATGWPSSSNQPGHAGPSASSQLGDALALQHARGSQHAIDARGFRPAPAKAYDMTAAATHDALVRRIIWIVVLALAVAGFLIVR